MKDLPEIKDWKVGKRYHLEMEVEQGVDVGVDLEDHVTAVAAVAAVRAAERLELLTMHRGATVSTSTGTNMQHDAVDEFGHGLILLLLTGRLR